MIIQKITKKYPEIAEDISTNLLIGLVIGVLFGLLCGFISGLAVDILFGILCGLIYVGTFGITRTRNGVMGIVGGLSSFLAYGIAFGLVTGMYPIVYLIIALLIITEILFWLDNKKINKKQSKLLFTLERKISALFEATLICGVYPYLYYLYSEFEAIQQFISESITAIYQFITTYGMYPLMFFGVVGLFGLWIVLNSLKYRNEKNKLM